MFRSHETSDREIFEVNMHHQDAGKTITEASVSNPECSIQETFDHIFDPTYFANTNISE